MGTLPYQTTKLLHEGKWTQTYLGTYEDKQTPVIIKILKQEISAAKGEELLRHEYEILQNISSPHVVKALQYDTISPNKALVFEYFKGETLASVIEKESLDLKSLLKLAIELTQGLGEIHHHHIIHKDIKPQNILIHLPTLQVKYIDFGLSTLLPLEMQQITAPALLEGTLSHISPEQTGRINRPIDYRTDIYSLGITLYQLFTKKLPFESSNSMELIHAQIAKIPTPIQEIDHSLPLVLSDIIAKCLAKDAEERYHSALGLKNDLEACLQQLKATGMITSFPIAQRDVFDQFHIPLKLYGRKKEVDTLYSCIQQSSKGKAPLIFVKGYSGIGKSSIVNEVQKSLIEKGGYFIRGKFNPYQKDIPYSALIQALQDLMRQILSESADQLKIWKEAVLKALGANAKVITDFLSELKQLIGESPEVPQLGPKEAENRLHLVLTNFIEVFLKSNSTLVLFLDDLQWADVQSLNFIEYFVRDPHRQYFCFIGAYRDNEVGPHHLLTLMLENLSKAQVGMVDLPINPLAQSVIQEWLQDIFQITTEKNLKLSEIIEQKTGGNPFFIQQLLKNFNSKGFFNFDIETQQWTIDLSSIKTIEVTENVAELMSSKIQQLGPATQNCLKIGSAIGHHFDLETLAMLQQTEANQSAKDLFPALQAELILKQVDVSSDQIEIITYNFQHDRIQQAAYQLISEKEKNLIHYRIGQALLKRTAPNKLTDSVMSIVSQLNSGIECVQDVQEKLQLSQLNLLAGQRAQNSAAYAQALDCYEHGIALLEADAWEKQYDLCMGLYSNASFCQQLLGHHQIAEELLDLVIKNAKSLAQKGQLYAQKIILYAQASQFELALKAGAEGLKVFGITFNLNPTKRDIILQLLKVKKKLLFTSKRKLRKRPKLTDENIITINKIYNNLVYPAFRTGGFLTFSIALKEITLALNHGLSPYSLYGFGVYCMFLGSEGVRQYREGYDWSQFALEQSQDYPLSETIVHGRLIQGIVFRWGMPLSKTWTLVKQTALLELEFGNIPYFVIGFVGSLTTGFQVGHTADFMLQEIDNFFSQLYRYYVKTEMYPILIIRQFYRNLKGLSENILDPIPQEPYPPELIDRDFGTNDENTALSMQFNHAIFHMVLLYLHGHYAEVIPIAEKQLIHKELAPSDTLWLSLYFFYGISLTALSIEEKSTKHLKTIRSLQRRIGRWAKANPENYLHQSYLISAEIAQLLGKKNRAEELYQLSIEAATKNGFIQDLGIACERLGKFYLNEGKEHFAGVSFNEARIAFGKWGAVSKVEQLGQLYYQYLSSFSLEHSTHTTSSQTSESTSVTSSQEFDINTLIEAFQVLSREIIIDRLIQAVMRIIIINAGADKAILLLPSQDKMWVRAEITGSAPEATLLDNQTVENKIDQLCVSAIHYVERSHEPLLLNNAPQEGHFTQDPYILSQKPQSIAIFPLIQQNKLMGIVYLENHVTKGAFTENRVRLLSILSTQIAISIANAEFYAELESKVQERTRDLQEAMQKLKEMQQQLILQEKLKEREIMKHKLGKYVPNPKVLEIVLERGMTLGGEQKEVTILFCDLRNFTALSETLTPEHIVEILNRFFTEMVSIVNRHQGIVDKFIGDAFMAVFGAFEMDDKHAQHAVEAAIEIQKKMKESFQEQKDKNVTLRAGVGINTGVVLMGNIGSEERYEYTAIGDNVNIASRLESLTKTMECDILITESTYKYLEHSIPVKDQGKVKVKGKRDELQIYEVLHD